jgi:putative ubiquitin-RnfH superfamily antitoxin RatB of RatAB toxin-antitoxin module
MSLRVDVIRAWPRRHESWSVQLPEDAVVADALSAAGLDGLLERDMALAIFGEIATPQTRLRDGDRIELLRPLQVDPKEARRRRAARG